MRVLLAVACLIGATLWAPDAFAAQAAPGALQTEETAPAEDYISRAERCRPQRRGGRMALVQRCDGNVVGAPSAFTGECAPRVAYRGHCRVLLPMRTCRPLLSNRPVDA